MYWTSSNLQSSALVKAKSGGAFKLLLWLVAMFLPVLSMAAEVSSPDGRIVFSLGIDKFQVPRYSVTFNGESVVDGSRLGLRFENAVVLSVISEGMPLVYNGQEAGNAKRLEFFEKDTIEWRNHPVGELYRDFSSGETASLDTDFTVDMPAWSYRVFVQ